MTPPSHGAVLTIDLDALAANYRLLAAKVAPGECAAVVKANAYGLGIEVAVPALLKAGCRTFFVAHLSEAARVRRIAPDAVLYVLNGLLPGMAPALAALDARPVLGSAEEIAEWRDFARTSKAPPAALHIDTGMNRLGLRHDEAGALDLSGIDLALVMSHFVSSEEPDNPLNARQRLYMAALAQTKSNASRSLDNSAALFHGINTESPQLLRVVHRAGYALYGGNPTRHNPNPMRPVIRLEAPVVAVRRVPKGESVGYNAQWTAKRDSIIAVISVGYADGYPRSASARDGAERVGEGRVGDVIVPFAGRVSMDLITLDVTDAPAGSVARGTMISLIDQVLDIDRVGENAGTIGYEVLTSLGQRYQRRTIGG